MSTRININVDNGGLPERNKQEAAVNRSGNLTRQSQSAAAKRGKQERNRQLKARGLNSQRNPLVTAPFRPTRPLEEPAANRQGVSLNLGHLWLYQGADTTTTQTGLYTFFAGSNVITATSAATSNFFVQPANDSTWHTFGFQPYTHTPPPTDTSFSMVSETVGTRMVLFRRVAAQAFTSFALPCGKGNFILVFCDASAWSDSIGNVYHYLFAYTPPAAVYTQAIGATPIGYSGSVQSNTGAQRTNRAYICNNTTIREISVPNIFSNLLDVLNPAPALGTSSGSLNGQSYTYQAYSLPFRPELGLAWGAGEGFLRDGFASSLFVYTPSIFADLHQYYDFVNTDNLKNFPVNKSWAMPDESEGAYRDASDGFGTMSEVYDSPSPAYHAYWANKNEYPDRRVWDPEYDYLDLPKPKRINKATLPPKAPNTRVGSYFRFTVWDWEDPAYCRAMCKALGFTEADLTP